MEDEVEDVAFQRRAGAAAVAVLDDQDHALHVASGDGAAERGDGVLDVGGEVGMAAALHARAVEGTRLEELPGIDAARVEGVVDGHLEELDDGVEPARGVGRGGALNVGVPSFGGSDHDARVGRRGGAHLRSA